jgi:hypothetical protein
VLHQELRQELQGQRSPLPPGVHALSLQGTPGSSCQAACPHIIDCVAPHIFIAQEQIAAYDVETLQRHKLRFFTPRTNYSFRHLRHAAPLQLA